MSPPAVFILLRHGYRLDWDIPNARSKTNLPYDPCLSDLGVRQAEETAAFLRDQFRSGALPPLTCIYSSPYYRTLETATPLAKALDVKINVEEGLTEFFGNSVKDVEPTPAQLSELRQLFPLIDASYTSMVGPPKNCLAETKDAFHDRLRTAVTRIRERHHGDGDETVICVTHAAGVVTATRALLGDSHASVNCPAAALVKMTLDRETGKYVIRENGVTNHLSTGELRNWSFPDEQPSQAS